MRKHIITAGGQVLLGEEMTDENLADISREFFREMGGADFFHRLGESFHRIVAADDLIGPMFRGDPVHHARRLAEHYIRMYGTPDVSEGWDERFLRAHIRHVIGNRHRRRWLELMRQAGEEINAPEPWFSDFMSTMTNGSGAVSAVSRGAALARGAHLNRDGEIVEGRDGTV